MPDYNNMWIRGLGQPSRALIFPFMDNLLPRREIFDHQCTGQEWQLPDDIFHICYNIIFIIRIEYDGKAHIRVRFGRTTLHHPGSIEAYPEVVARPSLHCFNSSIDLFS